MDGIAEFSILDGKMEFTILDGSWMENGKMAKRLPKKSSNSIEVHQKGSHCAEHGCHLPLKCDTGTAKRFLFVSPAYACAQQKLV